MSKLAHSNDETMYEIEMQNRGMYKLRPIPKPRCDYEIKRTALRADLGKTCRCYARYFDYDGGGGNYCKQHAEIIAQR